MNYAAKKKELEHALRAAIGAMVAGSGEQNPALNRAYEAAKARYDAHIASECENVKYNAYALIDTATGKRLALVRAERKEIVAKDCCDGYTFDLPIEVVTAARSLMTVERVRITAVPAGAEKKMSPVVYPMGIDMETCTAWIARYYSTSVNSLRRI